MRSLRGSVMQGRNALFLLLLMLAAVGIYSCNNTQGAPGGAGMTMPPPALPVITISNTPATTYQEFTASLEGTQNVDIHPQVEGYLEKIYVEEGAYVTKGQLLFAINSRPFDEQLNNAQANLLAAKANLANAQINVSKIEPLVKNNVVSDVQLKTAQASYDAAKASVTQAEAVVSNAQINKGYALLKAPVSGFIGRIPFKTGSLVGKAETTPLTVISDVKEVYAYFSMSESDFLHFTNQSAGKTIKDKIHGLPPVELELADKSIYAFKGRIELMNGQFDKTMGTISFRAIFPNAEGLLRTGGTGKVRIPQINTGLLPVPQTATYELQDRVFVFAVGDSNKVISRPLHIVQKTTNYYLVDKGVQTGDKIVFAGMDRLQDGAVVSPQILSADSLQKAMPF
ncbi:MAG TPA: efflux RND transporter periplasmic adaptor subunit [Puia sp.]|nr:efflux RND transporter periplasmic adaptor subunit [Puia sp.]